MLRHPRYLEIPCDVHWFRKKAGSSSFAAHSRPDPHGDVDRGRCDKRSDIDP